MNKTSTTNSAKVTSDQSRIATLNGLRKKVKAAPRRAVAAKAMKVEILRHHVLEGMRSFVIYPPNNNFQQGFVDALERTLRFIDEVELPWDVFYGGNYGGHLGLGEAEIGELCVGQYQRNSAVHIRLSCWP